MQRFMLKNGIFVDGATFKKLGKMYDHKITDYETCKAFMRERGNALYNPDHELCYIISAEEDGIYGYPPTCCNEEGDTNDCDVRLWFNKDKESEDFFCRFESLDFSPFVYWDFEKEGWIE